MSAQDSRELAPFRPPGGLAIIAALIAVVTAALYFEVPLAVRTAQSAVPDSATNVDLPGFRSDFWNVPDDELLGFVPIPAGPFLMGSDPDVDPLRFGNEKWTDGRTHGLIELPAFYIQRYEVTVGQYRAFVEATGYAADPAALQPPGDHPVSSVSWPDALAYARWLEAELRGSPDTPRELADALRDGWRLTLPTEAQWEKAARGTDGRVYPWGNQPRREYANFAATGTMPVGAYDCPECAYGLADMSGNVWEWTRSVYQEEGYDLLNERVNLEMDALWVIRGGGFGDSEQLVRAAVRGGGDPGVRRPFIGFRLVLTPPLPYG